MLGKADHLLTARQDVEVHLCALQCAESIKDLRDVCPRLVRRDQGRLLLCRHVVAHGRSPAARARRSRNWTSIAARRTLISWSWRSVSGGTSPSMARAA